MDNELERIWKEAVVTYLQYCTITLLEGTEETEVKIPDFQV
jgi:hypothetical protein